MNENQRQGGPTEIKSRIRSPNPLSEPLNSILREAIAEEATDIHLDPIQDGQLVRFRVDGVVHEKPTVSSQESRKILNQVKISANFGIDKSFMPEEGLLVLANETGTHDIRVTVAPVDGKEAIHFRLLSSSRKVGDLPELGVAPDEAETILSVLKASSGLILIAGGTGSGKSTTLYTLANAMDLKSKIAVSIEDPVELRLPYVRQVQVDEHHGLTMNEGLRVLLRMDPDAILVGEIRDQQSAVIAARAALAGRLVIASVHAPNCAATVDSLHNLSVPRYVLGGALRLIIKQALIRRICPSCAQEVPVQPQQRRLFERHGVTPPERILQASGCRKCNRYGYRGRVGVFEVAKIDTPLGDAIASGMLQSELQERFRQAGTCSVIIDALRKAAQGATSLEEVMQLCLAEQSEGLGEYGSG